MRVPKPYLSLIIPCYKQEKHIVQDLKQIIDTLDNTRYLYEVLVIIDGHVDDTFSKIKKADLHNLVAYEYRENRGKSYAIRFGMSRARGEHVMFLDSGMEIDPDGISMLLEHMKWYDADIVVGSKRHPVSQVKYTLQRKLLSYGYYYLVKILFGISVKDTQAGIKAFKKDVLLKILPRLVEKRFAGDLEMLIVAKHLGYKRIYEAPIKLNYQFSALSTATTLHSIMKISIDTLAIFYRKNILRYYDVPHRRFVDQDRVKRIIKE